MADLAPWGAEIEIFLAEGTPTPTGVLASATRVQAEAGHRAQCGSIRSIAIVDSPPSKSDFLSTSPPTRMHAQPD